MGQIFPDQDLKVPVELSRRESLVPPPPRTGARSSSSPSLPFLGWEIRFPYENRLAEKKVGTLLLTSQIWRTQTSFVCVCVVFSFFFPGLACLELGAPKNRTWCVRQPTPEGAPN